MFGILLSAKLATDIRLNLFQTDETLMTTFNLLPVNWQWLIFQRPQNHSISTNNGVKQ